MLAEPTIATTGLDESEEVIAVQEEEEEKVEVASFFISIRADLSNRLSVYLLRRPGKKPGKFPQGVEIK